MSLQQFIQDKLRDQAEDAAARKAAPVTKPVSASSSVPKPEVMMAFRDTVALNSRRAAHAQKLIRS